MEAIDAVRRCGARWLLVVLLGWLATGPAAGQEAARFVGTQTCAACHANAVRDWAPSDHARAMAVASPATVLGDFNDATLTHHGVATTFRRDGDAFMVRTEGPDGAVRDFRVEYTFGVDPLQQYLIALPGGRLQALGIAWDARPAAQGGQRWYHLYPDAPPPPGDRLHWTGRDQTWNYMCASCHSTGLVKNHDLATNRYATTWSEVNVACEACHGPGSAHVGWAEGRAAVPAAGLTPGDRMGLVAWLRANAPIGWEMDQDSGIARRSGPMPAAAQLDVCAPCHARRRVIAEDANPAAPLLDVALPALLEPGLYFADGQIDGEVFEWGSFVQSAMHRAGVSCTDCHAPHSAKLRAEGNAVCAQCHLPAKFETAAHHHHPEGAGAQCTACHMPTRVYMGVDARHDHSLRVPRPDLSVALGVPNACTQCHTDRDAAWAAQAVAGWFPQGRQTRPHFATALHAGRSGAVAAGPLLERLVLDATQPAIARATALPLLPQFGGSGTAAALRAGMTDADPLVRLGAARALVSGLPPALLQAALPLLSDPLRAVRIEAARGLAGAEPQAPEARAALERAVAELMAGELLDGERPESHLNLGLVHVRRRDAAAAEAAYRTALRLEPGFVPAMVNLADLQRQLGREAQGVEMLRRAVAAEPRNADALHALGLAMVRQRNYGAALTLLRQAAELAPENARYAYVYAVALNSQGMAGEADRLLQETHRRHPANREVLAALVSFAQARGDVAAALRHARALAVLQPDDAQLRQVIRQLEMTGAGQRR